MRLLCFTVNELRFGVATASVSEIVRAVAITPLPGAPAVIEGIIDVRGAIRPVFDLRRRFSLHWRPVEPADHFILVRAGARDVALHVDLLLDLVDVADTTITDPERRPATHAAIAGVATLTDGLVLIQDVETFLTAAESDTLESALDRQTAGVAAP